MSIVEAQLQAHMVYSVVGGGGRALGTLGLAGWGKLRMVGECCYNNPPTAAFLKFPCCLSSFREDHKGIRLLVEELKRQTLIEKEFWRQCCHRKLMAASAKQSNDTDLHLLMQYSHNFLSMAFHVSTLCYKFTTRLIQIKTKINCIAF